MVLCTATDDNSDDDNDDNDDDDDYMHPWILVK